jgi:hypothetical protein
MIATNRKIMNANRTRIVAERIEPPRSSRRHTLTLDQDAVLSSLGMLLAISALWPMSLGHGREYTFLTLAALLVIRSSNWLNVDNDESTIKTGGEAHWASPPDFVFF